MNRHCQKDHELVLKRTSNRRGRSTEKRLLAERSPNREDGEPALEPLYESTAYALALTDVKRELQLHMQLIWGGTAECFGPLAGTEVFGV